jgi:Zn-dependent protease
MKGYSKIKFFHIFGAQVQIHWSVFLVMGGILALSIRTPIIALITICSYFGIILLHEAGHAFFARRLGCQPYAIYLNCLHGLCEYELPYDKKDDAIIAWGGVTAQFVVAIPLIFLAQSTSISEIAGLGPVVAFLGYISAFIALVNLAPSPALDGHKAWALIPILWAERKK